MTLGFDAIPLVDSWLCHRDPRWKLAALGVAAAAAATLRTLPTSALALAGALLLALLGRLPPRWYLARLGAVVPFLLFVLLLLPFLVHEERPLWSMGPLALSFSGLRTALLVCLKALTVVTLTLTLLVSAPLHVTLQAALRLQVPGLLIHLTLLTYRYIFLFAEELARVRLALRVRGFRSRANLHSYRTVAHVAGALLVRSQERAERVSQAMRCRGFAGCFHSLAEFRTAWSDLVLFLVVLGSVAALLMWDWWARG